jgi:hypothetical protein
MIGQWDFNTTDLANVDGGIDKLTKQLIFLI